MKSTWQPVAIVLITASWAWPSEGSVNGYSLLYRLDNTASLPLGLGRHLVLVAVGALRLAGYHLTPGSKDHWGQSWLRTRRWTSRRRFRWWIRRLQGLAAIVAIVILVQIPPARDPFTFAQILALVGLTAVWATLAHKGGIRRVFTTAVIFPYSCLVCGLEQAVFGQTEMFVPLQFLAAAGVLFLTRRVNRRVRCLRPRGGPHAARWQFSLASLVALMTLLALVLSYGRIGWQEFNGWYRYPSPYFLDWRDWHSWGSYLAFAVQLLCAVEIMLSPQSGLEKAVAPVLGGVAACLLYWALTPANRCSAETYQYQLRFLATFGLSLLLPLSLARARGYRLCGPETLARKAAPDDCEDPLLARDG